MKCKNCGAQNRPDASFCGICGYPLKRQDGSKNRRILFTIIGFISLFIIGIILVSCFGQPEIESISIDGNYNKEDSIYQFNLEDEYVLVTPETKFRIGGTSIDCEIDDTYIATCSSYSGNVKKIMFSNPGKTKMIFYCNGKRLGVMEFEVIDNSSSKTSKSSTSNSVKKDENINFRNYEAEVQEIKNMMPNYFAGYESAVNYGDFDMVSGYIDENGPEYSDTKDSILDTYNRGTTLELINCQMTDINEVSEGEFVATYQVQWHINSVKKGSRYQTEAADFTIHKKNGSYVVYKMSNWHTM